SEQAESYDTGVFHMIGGGDFL
ncbi:MAG: hypothetical protein RJA70_4761, partial [Pseudomonadota bacterium]